MTLVLSTVELATGAAMSGLEEFVTWHDVYVKYIDS